MATQPPSSEFYPAHPHTMQQQIPSTQASPYLRADSTPSAHLAAPPKYGSVGREGVPVHSGAPDFAVTVNDKSNVEGKWSSGLKECYKEPSHCFLAIFWPCGIAAKVAQAVEVSPTRVGTFFAIALIGDIIFTALAWHDAYSDGAKPKILRNLNLYYFAGKPPSSHWSPVGHFFGVLFVYGTWALRSRTQKHYGIRRRILFDLYATLLCTCCSMAQMSKHVALQSTKKQQQAGQVDVLQAYS